MNLERSAAQKTNTAERTVINKALGSTLYRPAHYIGFAAMLA